MQVLWTVKAELIHFAVKSYFVHEGIKPQFGSGGASWCEERRYSSLVLLFTEMMVRYCKL